MLNIVASTNHKHNCVSKRRFRPRHLVAKIKNTASLSAVATWPDSWPRRILGSKYRNSSFTFPCFCSMISSTIFVRGRLCFFTTRFLTPAMTKLLLWLMRLLNMETALVVPWPPAAVSTILLLWAAILFHLCRNRN